MYLWPAILIGFLGSAHCIGMCGPILLAVNQGRGSWKNNVLHHSGRLLVYMFLGIVAGALGSTFSFMGFQQTFSLLIGSIMVFGVVLYLLGKRTNHIESYISSLAIKFNGLVHNSGMNKSQVRFLTGVGNGILPCGLVYISVAGAANTYTPWDGGLFMLAFGIGTLPALLGVTQFGSLISMPFRNKVRKLIPITVFVMGALLMLRGSNLGIPYLSPQQSVESAAVEECH